MGSASHADCGERSPDIIEALHELIWRHDSPPMLKATASPRPSESSDRLSVFSVPQDGTRATSGNSYLTLLDDVLY